MTPTWQTDDGAIQLYLGDCLEILPTLEPGSVDCVVTDPPYGLADRWQGGTWGSAEMYSDARCWDNKLTQEQFAKSCMFAPQSVVWGGNYYEVPASRCWLSWIKSSSMPTMADFELAWTNLDRPAKSLREDRNPDGKRTHPTQKPLSVMLWSCGFTSGTVADPFMGSGTTGVACARLGRRFIGIEKEPRYFEIAKKRILAELNRTPLFDAPRQRQKSLLSEE